MVIYIRLVIMLHLVNFTSIFQMFAAKLRTNKGSYFLIQLQINIFKFYEMISISDMII